MNSVQLLPLSGIPEVVPGDDFATLILDALRQEGTSLRHGDVLVLAQKIVSKAEGRLVPLAAVHPSPRATQLAQETGKDPRLVELILKESNEVLRTRPGLIIVAHRLGFVMANAGIDQSNVLQEDEGVALLLPVDPDASCAQLRERLQAETGAEIAVSIIDSHGRAWRNGIVGVTIGAAGMSVVQDLRGHADRHGRTLAVTEVAQADEIAAAASLVMGQAAEGRPVVLVRGLPDALGSGTAKDLVRDPQLDLFR